MTDDTVTVHGFEDIEEHISERRALDVVRVFNEGAETVMVVEPWLLKQRSGLEEAGEQGIVVDDSGLTPVDGTDNVFAGTIESQSEKAWLFATGEASDWIPKSQSVVFQRFRESKIETPQRGLGDFA